jgi:ABC-type phosphate transport system substrate-binding protein
MQLKTSPRDWLIRCLFLAALTVATNACADVVVIVSAKSTVTRLTPEQTAKIFLGKVDTFPDGGDVLAIDQEEGSAIRDEFYAKIAHKNSSQLTAYWAKIIFSGDGHPPRMVAGDATVRKAVANNPNTIGYIDKHAVDKSVRVILEP